METQDIMSRIDETKALIRRVRTPAGVAHYDQPIGSIITRDPLSSIKRRRRRRKASGRDEQTLDVSMAENRPQERSAVRVEAQTVAPDPELPYVDERAKVPKSSNRGVSFQSRVQLYTNEAPMRDQINRDYLANATVKEAAQDLIEMGASLRISPEFLRDRDFMVSLAETVRIHEEMFPGFIYRHGNFYAGRKNMGGKPGVIAYNKTITRYDSEDDSIRSMYPDEHPYTTSSGHDLSGNIRTGAASSATSLNPAPEMTQSITVFLPPVIESSHQHLHGGHAAKGENLGFFAANDWWTDMREAIGDRQAAMIYLMTHEFGHAINNTVSGNMSFEIDGWEDPEQYKRRWYAEYYNNAQMDLFEDMGVFTRTGKKYEGDHIKAEVDHYKNAILLKEHYLDQYNEYRKEVLEWHAQDTGERTHAWEDFFESVIGNYDFPPNVAEYLRESRTRVSRLYFHDHVDATLPKAPAVDDAFSMVIKNRYASLEGLDMMEQLMGGMSGAPTFKRWEDDGYITDFNVDAWKNLVSGYASKKVVEFEAESWASYMLDRQTTEATQRWGNAVHDMYTWWVQDDMDSEFGQNNPEEG